MMFSPWSTFDSHEKCFLLQQCSRWTCAKSKAEGFGSQTLTNTIEAFSHWTNEKGKGSVLVDVLEVSALESGGHQVTDVFVHSKDLLRYSAFNLGSPGIEQFYCRHSCNDIFRLVSPQLTLVRAAMAACLFSLFTFLIFVLRFAQVDSASLFFCLDSSEKSLNS